MPGTTERYHNKSCTGRMVPEETSEVFKDTAWMLEAEEIDMMNGSFGRDAQMMSHKDGKSIKPRVYSATNHSVMELDSKSEPRWLQTELSSGGRVNSDTTSTTSESETISQEILNSGSCSTQELNPLEP